MRCLFHFFIEHLIFTSPLQIALLSVNFSQNTDTFFFCTENGKWAKFVMNGRDQRLRLANLFCKGAAGAVYFSTGKNNTAKRITLIREKWCPEN